MPLYVTGSDGFIGREVMKLLPDAVPLLKDLNSLGVSDFSDCEGVIHLAAAGVAAKDRNWQSCLLTNVLGVDRMLDCVGDAPVVFARSFMEDSPVWDDPYFSSKRIGSLISRKRENIRFARIFHVYGKGVSGVLKYAKECLLEGCPATFGSGKGQRDWIHVHDAARGLVACLSQPPGDYDIGTGHLRSLKEIIATMKIAIHSESELIFDPSRDRDDVDVVISASKFPAGWLPKVNLIEGLREYLES